MKNKTSPGVGDAEARKIKLVENGPDLPQSPNESPPLRSTARAVKLSAMGEAALRYVALRIPVFPCSPKDKSPLVGADKDENGRPIAGTGGFYRATTDADQIRAWWTKSPHAMIGMATGPASGVDILDLDVKNGKDGLAKVPNWRDLSPIISRTPSGGAHLWFKSDGTIPSTADKIDPGVDTRGTGGYAIIPPSRGRGKAYWFENSDDELENLLPSLPPFPADLRARLPQEDNDPRTPGNEPEADIVILSAALDALPNDYPWFDEWNRVAMATYRATGGSDEGFALFDKWSQKWPGYNAEHTAARWEALRRSPPTKIGAGTIFHLANEAAPGWRGTTEGVSLDDFRAYMPMHNYIYTPSREPWPATSVNARLRPMPLLDAHGSPVLGRDGNPKEIKASTWLDQNRSVEQMTWAPGLPMLIADRLISDGGWIERPGVTSFNLYRPPAIIPGNAAEAGPWLDLMRKIYPDDADHMVKWLAHRVQKPQEKINHALVLIGAQGIGKDTMLEPVKRAVGPWNFSEVSPKQLLGRFNGFIKSVVLRVSEARDLGDVNRYQLYDHMKVYTAAPPDVLRVDEKNLREHSVFNCCGVIITSNNKDSLYLPADDRRHYVAWSDRTKDDFTEDYWRGLWRWYDDDGFRHVAAYLTELDITAFDAKAPPPKTPVFWQIVETNRAPEDSELADIIDRMGNPKATTIINIAKKASELGGYVDGSFYDWITNRKNRRAIPHRMEECGYVSVRNEAAKTGLWVVGGTRQVVYARAELSVADRYRAVAELMRVADEEAVRRVATVAPRGRPRG